MVALQPMFQKELDPVQTPAFDANGAAVLVDNALNRARYEWKSDYIAYVESSF